MAKNLMQGDQHAIPFVLKMKDGTLITDSMVKTVVLNLGNLSRQYPGDVTYKNGQWLFPVTQAQTFAMRGSVEPQARVEFLNDDIFGGAGEPVELQNALNKGIIGTDGTTAAKQNAPTMQTELQGAILVIVAAAGVEFSAEGAVRYDEPQQLTDEQKAQAQQNIGVKAVTPDYQENDPESPNYIRNRNGGYYTWDEENPIGRYRVYNGQTFPNTLDFAGGRPDETAVYCAVVMRGTIKTQFVRRFNYFLDADNAAELGFYLHSWNPTGPSYRVTYVPAPTDITDIKVYDVMPVAFPRDLLEIPLAGQIEPGLVAVQDVIESDGAIFGRTNTFIQRSTNPIYNGQLKVPKPWVQVPSFEYSESGGMVPNNVDVGNYVGNGFVVKSSNYLAGILGIEDTDFPVQIVGASVVYGSGLPYVPCQFFTKTGKSGFFDWRVNGKAENAVLNATGSDSDIFVVRFTQDGNTWSADKTYAEIKQALDDGKVVQGVIYDDFIGIGALNGEIVSFRFSGSSFKSNLGIYGLKNLIIIVNTDGITVHDSWDEPWGEYHNTILPSQVLLVINDGGNISAKLNAFNFMENPITYLMSYNEVNTFPELTALYVPHVPPVTGPERFYFSNVVTTPDSATSSTKVDFIFKSADATKTLTGSVTKPNDWDDETPLAETWTYTETDPLDGAVRYDKSQSLTDAQKQQARDNIGVVDVPTPSAENVGKIPVSKQVGDGYKYVMEDKSTSDLSLGLTGASVGQVPVVESVDTQGKPTTWVPSSAPGILLVTITQNNAGEFTCDKTNTEIYKAFSAGKIVISDLPSWISDNRMQCVFANDTYARFIVVTRGSTTSSIQSFHVSTNTVTDVQTVEVDDEALLVSFSGSPDNSQKLITFDAMGAPIIAEFNGLLYGEQDGSVTSLGVVTEDDNGKFLRVVDGMWQAVTVDNANGVSF